MALTVCPVKESGHLMEDYSVDTQCFDYLVYWLSYTHLTLEMGSGVFFDPREMKRVYLPVCTGAKGTLGSKKTPKPFSVSFLTTHF